MYTDYSRSTVIGNLNDRRSQRELSRAAASRYAQLEAAGATRSGRRMPQVGRAFAAGVLRAVRTILRRMRRTRPAVSHSSVRP